jgi:hypothetical protein
MERKVDHTTSPRGDKSGPIADEPDAPARVTLRPSPILDSLAPRLLECLHSVGGRSMPLHDWNQVKGWDGVNHLWIAELLHWIKPRLPEGYRAYIGSAPLLAVGEPEGRPDVSVRTASVPPLEDGTGAAPASQEPASEPDEEVAVATLDPTHTLFVAREGWLVAAVELVSPRNKDRLAARALSTSRYAGYLLSGVHLLLVDVHPRPYAFSFADEIARELQFTRPPCPPPAAVVYRVGEPAPTGGRLLATWRRRFEVGAALPTLRLPLTAEVSVPVDLEQSYMRAASAAYLT